MGTNQYSDRQGNENTVYFYTLQYRDYANHWWEMANNRVTYPRGIGIEATLIFLVERINATYTFVLQVANVVVDKCPGAF